MIEWLVGRCVSLVCGAECRTVVVVEKHTRRQWFGGGIEWFWRRWKRRGWGQLRPNIGRGYRWRGDIAGAGTAWEIHRPLRWDSCSAPRRLKSSSWQAISELRGVTEVWCHTILLAARHKWAHPALTPASEGWYSIYLPRRDGRLSWLRCLDYTPAANWTHDQTTWSKVRRPNLCTIKITSDILLL